MTTLTDPPAAETQQAVAELRSTRRRRRLGDTNWGDLAYRVYTTAFFVLVIAVMLSGWVGDSEVEASDVGQVAADGPAWAGLVFAAVILAAIRSGSRGGPISLDAADVHHLLLAPTNRTATLRRPTISVLGYGVLTGVVAAGVVGSLMSQRLPGTGAEWLGSGTLFGAVMAATALGAALFTCSRTTPRAVPLGIGWLLLIWAIADVAGWGPTAPTTFAGNLLFLPMRSGITGLGWIAIAIVAAIAGAMLIGGLSIEAARRRTTLVGQLRFAVTLQDMRSVVLLRRQLASETPRNKPWFPIPRAFGRRFPVTARDLQSVAHWPPIRIIRVLVLAIGAGLAIRGLWSGTTPLIIVAGLATYVAALDATEPLSQEIDHPTLTGTLPVDPGTLMVRHLVEPVLVLIAAGTVALGVSYAVDPAPDMLGIGALTVVTASLAAVAGAAISIVSPTDSGGSDALMTPEVAGPRMVFRTAGPPVVAMLGFLPVLVAARVTGDTDPFSIAATVTIPVLILVMIVFAWVRFRSDIAKSMAESMSGETKK